MSQPVEFDPNTASFEQIEQYLAQPDPQQADAAGVAPEPDPEDVETAYADIQLDEQPATAPAEPVQAEKPTTYSAQEYEAAINRKAKEVRESITKSEEYLLYKDMVARRAKADGVSQKEAVKRIRDEMFAQEAERLSKDPKALAEALLRSQMPQEFVSEEPAPAPQPTTEDRVKALAGAVRTSMQNGRLPSDFSIEKCLSIYPEFFDTAAMYGEAAAVLVAEERFRALPAQEMARRISAQRSAPQSFQPSGQTAPVPRGIADMSEEEFQKLDRQVDQLTNAGIHVRL